ncbi:lipase [Nocardia terpenica]|uniref:lipase n=1 Tax=Nocardia terpenica TaxID=455432 RepID=UPI002FDF3956
MQADPYSHGKWLAINCFLCEDGDVMVRAVPEPSGVTVPHDQDRRRMVARACLASGSGLTFVVCVAASDVVVDDAVLVPATPPLPLRLLALPRMAQAFCSLDPAGVIAAQLGETLTAPQVILANLWLPLCGIRAWQLSCRSTHTRGESIPAVATVIVRYRPSPRSERQLVSLQFAEHSLSQDCRSLYALRMGSLSSLLDGVTQFEFVKVRTMPQLGHSVVIPRNAGTNGAYAVEPWGGRITLTLESDFFGSVSGGLIADARAAAGRDGGTSTFGSAVLGDLLEVAREWAVVAQCIDRYLRAVGKELRDIHENQCVSLQLAGFPFVNTRGLFDCPGGKPIRAPELQEALDRLALGHRGIPKVPLCMDEAPMGQVTPANGVNHLCDTFRKDSATRCRERRETDSRSMRTV